LSRSITKPWAPWAWGLAPTRPTADARRAEEAELRDVAQKDRLRMTPVAKKVLQEASQPNRRKLYVTAQQVLAQILALQPPDPAAVLLALSA